MVERLSSGGRVNSENAWDFRDEFNSTIATDPLDDHCRTPILPNNNMTQLPERAIRELDAWISNVSDEDVERHVLKDLEDLSGNDLKDCIDAFDEDYRAGCQQVIGLVAQRLNMSRQPRLKIHSAEQLRRFFGEGHVNSDGFYDSSDNIIYLNVDRLGDDIAETVNTVAHEMYHSFQSEVANNANGGNEDQWWTLYRYNSLHYKRYDTEGRGYRYDDYRRQLIETEAFLFGDEFEKRFVEAEQKRNGELAQIGATYQERRVIFGILSGDFFASREGDPAISRRNINRFIDLVSSDNFDREATKHDYLNYIPSQLEDYVEGPAKVWEHINGPKRHNGEVRSEALRRDELTIIGFLYGGRKPELINVDYLEDIGSKYPNLMDFQKAVDRSIGQLSGVLSRERFADFIKARNELGQDLYYHQKRYYDIIEDLYDKVDKIML